MTLAEAARHAVTLRADPSSAIAAAIEGWDHPISREALVLMDLFDLEHSVNSKKTPKPHHGRPWASKGEVKRRGNAAGRTHEQVRQILNAHGHNL